MTKLLTMTLVAGGCLLAAQTGAFGEMLINGAGATFPNPLYQKWFDQYSKVDEIPFDFSRRMMSVAMGCSSSKRLCSIAAT